MTKMTKRDYFNQILSKYPLTSDEIAFINHELEMLARKNTGERKVTDAQILNENLKNVIENFLVKDGRSFTITELIKAVSEINDCSNQKISRLANDMVKENRLSKYVDKGKTYFCKA